MRGIAAILLAAALAVTDVRGQEESANQSAPEASPSPAADAAPSPEPSAGEQPSAELIIDAEQKVANEPGMAPADEPLPQLEGKLPGEDNIFGNDLFGTGELYAPETPEMPSAPPVIEDPREGERKMRVKFRKVKAKLEADPGLIALKETAANAPTPEDGRAAQRAYYALLFAKVRKADASLKDYADALEKGSVAGLYQTRIQPTVPLNPPPEPQPAAQLVPPNQYPDVLPAGEEPVALP